MATATQGALRKRVALSYLGLVGVPLTILFIVLHEGQKLSRPLLHEIALPAVKQAPAAGLPNLALLMAQIGLIILFSRLVGSLIEKIGQPRVIGEVLAGILLGPSFLGWVAPALSASFFPPGSFGVLNALSQLGLVLFMFMVGLELDIKELPRQGHVAVLVSPPSITAPMALGGVLALFLSPRLSDS